MKMADSEKAEEFVDAECPSECLDEAQSATTSVQGEQDEHFKTLRTLCLSPSVYFTQQVTQHSVLNCSEVLYLFSFST